MNAFTGMIGQTLYEYLPSLCASGAATLISALMSVYDGRPIIKTVTGALSCGILALTIAGSLELFGLPGHSVTFVGASIGFVGVERIRRKVISLFERKASGQKSGNISGRK
ncbi:phage holin family protein [Erwinia sp. HR93]|uniref:phage holin family protein n=1 Tax=Erwinia sp. HR93 TaxID=3094840 RepID=UPI002ADECAED|nr:phage holin family protein [Erwinia sp. HR93]MEA1064360.1 phage holin family protein [Erwinia sp. HR93]